MIFSCHGSPGEAVFDGKKWTFHDYLDGNTGKYSRLFRGFGRVYFQSCNVADDEQGDKFLKMVGRTFFRVGGGFASGWTVKMIANDGVMSALLQVASSSPLLRLRNTALPLVLPFINDPRFKMATVAPGGSTIQIQQFNP